MRLTGSVSQKQDARFLSLENPVKDLDRYDYMSINPQCAVCYWPADRRGRWLELHHIVGGSGRKDCLENWIPLCCRCHHAVHNKLPDYGELPKGSILTAKEELDVLDEKKLASLKGRQALPYEKCPIPDKFLADREVQGGAPWP